MFTIRQHVHIASHKYLTCTYAIFTKHDKTYLMLDLFCVEHYNNSCSTVGSNFKIDYNRKSSLNRPLAMITYWIKNMFEIHSKKKLHYTSNKRTLIIRLSITITRCPFRLYETCFDPVLICSDHHFWKV